MATTELIQQPTVYRGRVKGHDYEVRARHGMVDTTATVIIDGVAHEHGKDKHGKDEERTAGAESGELTIRTEEAFGKAVYTVRRVNAKGKLRDAEQIVVRTAGFGGKGEVDVLGSIDPTDISRTPLAPAHGSASWQREQRRLARPVRFALGSAAFTAAKFLVPLLGIGALFGWLLRPAREAVESAVRPPVEAVAEFLRPVGDLIGRVKEYLLGWVPDLAVTLPFDVPGWVVDVAVPGVVVLVVFVATLVRLRKRRRQLEP